MARVSQSAGKLDPANWRVQHDLRRFLFHTAFPSGATPDFPLATDENLGTESRMPLPVFATSLGFEADSADPPGSDELSAWPEDALSPILDATVPAAPLAARKVLLTETALKVAGFLTVDDVLPCPFSPS